ncbi:MAG: hypothetical protein ABFR32_09215 [Bacteroidota bacterium]
MKKAWIFFLIVSINSNSQTTVKSFFELSSPEKCWVIFHPFKANKAFKISKETLRITDSVIKVKVLDTDINGGLADAFKHSFWMAGLSRQIGDKAALKLGKAHEKGNYRTFKKNNKEDGFVPDKPSSDMDLYNNQIGAQLSIKNSNASKNELITIVINEIKTGKMKILKKDSLGNFLTCEGKIIPIDSLKGKWENNKCLVFSNSE